MRRFVEFYTHMLHRYKYPVQIASGGLLWLGGDLVSQTIQAPRREHFDWDRTARMVAYGMAFSAPAYTFWYSFLDKWTHRIFDYQKHTARRGFFGAVRWRTWKIIGFKLLADTLIFDPVYLSLFFGVTNLMEGKSLGEVWSKLRREFWMTYAVDVAVWFPIQMGNFKFVQVPYQPLVVQSCNIGWNAYLSSVQHRESK